MVRILRTTDVEGSIRALVRRHERVLARASHTLWNPIRLRRKKIADLNPYLVMNAPEFDSEFLAWDEGNGLLVYQRMYSADENMPWHHAQVLAECPLSIEMLDKLTVRTRDVAVIYRPPTWDEHWRCIRDTCPDATLCRAFFEATRRAAEISDDTLSEAMGLTGAQLTRVRSATLKSRDFLLVEPVRLRYPPDDATLRRIYDHIGATFSQVDGRYMVVGRELSKFVRFWRVALRSLERCGSIARDCTVGVYREAPEPAWAAIQARHDGARAGLDAIIRLVEGAPEHALPKQPRRSRPAQSLSLSASS